MRGLCLFLICDILRDFLLGSYPLTIDRFCIFPSGSYVLRNRIFFTSARPLCDLSAGGRPFMYPDVCPFFRVPRLIVKFFRPAIPRTPPLVSFGETFAPNGPLFWSVAVVALFLNLVAFMIDTVSLFFYPVEPSGLRAPPPDWNTFNAAFTAPKRSFFSFFPNFSPEQAL